MAAIRSYFNSHTIELNNLADDPACVDERNRLALALREWMEQTGNPLLEGTMAQDAYRQRMHAFKRFKN